VKKPRFFLGAQGCALSASRACSDCRYLLAHEIVCAPSCAFCQLPELQRSLRLERDSTPRRRGPFGSHRVSSAGGGPKPPNDASSPFAKSSLPLAGAVPAAAIPDADWVSLGLRFSPWSSVTPRIGASCVEGRCLLLRYFLHVVSGSNGRLGIADAVTFSDLGQTRFGSRQFPPGVAASSHDASRMSVAYRLLGLKRPGKPNPKEVIRARAKQSDG